MLLSIMLLLILLSSRACLAAPEEEDYGYIASEPEYPLLLRGIYVDGEHVRVKSLPVNVEAGSTVCVAPAIYTDIDRRYAFRGWDDGLGNPCRAVSANATYTAVYVEQVLVQVFSELREYSRSFWVDVGEMVNLTVPEIVEKEGVQYRFVEWSGGERPWSPTNHLVAVKPVRVELKWEPRYLLALTSSHGVLVNGSGYYGFGSIAVISAPDEVVLEPGRKLVFERWVSVGPIPAIIPNEGSSTTTLRVEGPYIIKAVYSEMYYVEVLGVAGETVVKRWAKAGEVVQVSVKPVVEVIKNEVRYVFRGWSEPSLPQIPSFTVSVEKPLIVKAIYEREYMVEAVGEYGISGGGWYPENSTAILKVPATPRTMLLLKTVFNGWAGDLEDTVRRGETLIVYVRRPVKIKAMYSIEPDYISIAVLVGVIAVLAAAGLRGGKRKHLEAYKQTEEAVEVEA